MDLIHALIQGLWVVLPAYVANGAAPVFGGERRMDFGKRFMGDDLLGAGKTWEGFLFAVLSGSVCGIVQILLWSHLNQVAAGHGFYLPLLSTVAVVLIPFFAMFGDLVASFLKRRFGVKRGESLPLVDQLDFMVFSIPVALLLAELSYLSVLVLFVITPPVHYLFNLIGYNIGVKEVPW